MVSVLPRGGGGGGGGRHLVTVPPSWGEPWALGAGWTWRGGEAQVAAKPAAGEPIRMAPVEHVQLFKVKYSRQKKWHAESASH